jgi:hypothetical protein
MPPKEPWLVRDERSRDGWRVLAGRRLVAVFERLEDAEAAVAAVNAARGFPARDSDLD